MTQTCKSCHEPDCVMQGQDMRACEHHVRLSDIDPQPVVTNPPDSSQESWVDCPFYEECDAIVIRLRRVERALHDIGRAVRGELL